jgi:Tfp pilus assembly protein PilP
MEYAALEIRTRLGKGLFLALVTLGLAACGSDNDDLDQYINEVKARLRRTRFSPT